MKVFVQTAIVLFMSTFFLACGDGLGHMTRSSADIVTEADVATIVFYRSTRYGKGIRSGIFDVTAETKFHGGLVGKDKLVVQVPAGDYTFMVLGENADFAYATVESGKLYYMNIYSRPGAWKARFSLRPISSEKYLEATQKAQDCMLVEMTEQSTVWFNKHYDNIEQKRDAYYQKWMEKEENSRPRLLPTDYQPQ